jgi:hypothetical protein
MKNVVFWDVTPYGFYGSLVLTRATRRNIPEGAILQSQFCCKTLSSFFRMEIYQEDSLPKFCNKLLFTSFRLLSHYCLFFALNVVLHVKSHLIYLISLLYPISHLRKLIGKLLFSVS